MAPLYNSNASDTQKLVHNNKKKIMVQLIHLLWMSSVQHIHQKNQVIRDIIISFFFFTILVYFFEDYIFYLFF